MANNPKGPPGNGGERNDDDDQESGSLALPEPEVLPPDTDPVNIARLTLDVSFEALLKVAERGKQVEDGLTLAERVLELRERAEGQRIKHLRETMSLVLEAKLKDPDEIDRRESEKFRRGLMAFVALIAAGTTAGCIVIAALGGSIVGLGVLAGIATMSIAFTAALASGQVLTPRNLVAIMRGALGRQEAPKKDRIQPGRRANKRRKP